MELPLIVTTLFLLLGGVFYSAERYRKHNGGPEQRDVLPRAKFSEQHPKSNTDPNARSTTLGVTMVRFIDSLWGGTLAGFLYDPVNQTCQLEVHVSAGGITKTHMVRCQRVSEMRFFNENPGPWLYAEVTELAASFDDISSCWHLEFALWSDQAGLVIRSREVLFDGAPLFR